MGRDDRRGCFDARLQAAHPSSVSDGTPAEVAGAVASISRITFSDVVDAMVASAVGQAHVFNLAVAPGLPADTAIFGVSLVAAAFKGGA